MGDRLTGALDRMERRFISQTGTLPGDAVSDQGALLIAAQAASRLADQWDDLGDTTHAEALRTVLETAVCGKEDHADG
jgi:hypothetical protein